MNYLARREHTHDELFQKLRQKQFDNADIQQVIHKLAEEGLQSNARFIENYIHFRRAKGYGPLRIQAELAARGLNEEFIEEHLKIADNSWNEALHQLWQKRFKGIVPSDFQTRGQQMRFLQYRGFTQQQIEQLYRQLT